MTTMTSRRERIARVCVGAAVGATLVACDGFTGKEGDRPEGFRLVEGRIVVPDDATLLGRQVTGLQLAALHLRVDGGITAFPSAVFDPSAVRAEASFVATVQNDLDVVLVLQVPSATQRGAGSFLGVFSDASETLIARGEDDLDLGTVTISFGARTPADTTLAGGPGSSPATQTDSDGDGLNNGADDDDDDDGTLDATDDDVAGDGIDDALQRLPALTDDDADGVPDALR